jgi:(E)-4-hydroxy-3-methylbut-2-enyl-diphosphate synthase
MINRVRTKVIHIGKVAIGGENPIAIQSMTNTHTEAVKATVAQIRSLTAAGCHLLRIAVPNMDAAQKISQIKSQVSVPLIADIHFDHKLAIESIRQGIDGLRINPGNITSESKVAEIVSLAKERKIPIRIGVNSGSLSKDKLRRYGMSAQAIVESALEHVAILEKLHYYEMKISVKSSSVPLTIESYRQLSKKVEYPLHLGVTEAGTEFAGTIKSSVGIGTLLAEGIGDTIRVSLTADPLREVLVARQLLQSLELLEGLEIISCPTCGRTNIDVIAMSHEVEKRLQPFKDKQITVAVMGCEVNGPGEAREADFGIAGGKAEGLIFKKGKIIKKVSEKKLIDELISLIDASF